jgi:Na+-driven multidrug efflux pump
MGLILIAWAIPAIYTLTNTYFIGRMEMEAIAISEQYETVGVLLEILLEMFPLAVLALVARNLTDATKVMRVVKSAALMQLAVTVAFMAFIMAGTGLLVDCINTPEEIRERTISFLQIKALAIPFEALGLLFILAIKTMRRGWLAIGIAAIGVVLNFTLDAIMISDFSFSLRLGLTGSAWDYVISKIVILLIAGFAFYHTIRSKPNFEFDRKEAGTIFHIGKFAGMESAVRNAGYIMGMLIVLNTLGTAEYGGYGVAMTILWLIFLIPVLGLGEATNIAIGNEYGKHDLRGMKNIQVVSLAIMGSYMAAVIVAGVFIWQPLSQFFNQNPSIVEYSGLTFQYLAIPYLFYALGTAMRSLLIGTGKTSYYLIPSMVVNLGIYIPLGILVKANVYAPTFAEVMGISFFVFAIDLVIVTALVRKHYRNLEEELSGKTELSMDEGKDTALAEAL